MYVSAIHKNNYSAHPFVLTWYEINYVGVLVCRANGVLLVVVSIRTWLLLVD